MGFLGNLWDGLGEVLDASGEIYEDAAKTVVTPVSNVASNIKQKISIVFILFVLGLIIFCVYKFTSDTSILLWSLAILACISLEMIIRGKKSIVLKILKYVGLPGMIFAGSFFSRDSFLVKSVRGVLQGTIAFIHGVLSNRSGYNRGYEDAIKGRKKCWWRK
ncbi:MAG: hypothetical protein SPL10_04155 [Synergistales bacterium]|nr:hypothetical protein [Synergistales bacterium]MDY6401593.1 hypothetical protein [Synergistales bacterium]MDY6404867.1 hypothetical protein [Synergistales bacterium]MDY6410593.1 hypothetical protein [Synergistales bacterium]MDY6414337.1 hypothetical protein [Synergistales bacterium]